MFRAEDQRRIVGGNLVPASPDTFWGLNITNMLLPKVGRTSSLWILELGCYPRNCVTNLSEQWLTVSHSQDATFRLSAEINKTVPARCNYGEHCINGLLDAVTAFQYSTRRVLQWVEIEITALQIVQSTGLCLSIRNMPLF